MFSTSSATTLECVMSYYRIACRRTGLTHACLLCRGFCLEQCPIWDIHVCFQASYSKSLLSEMNAGLVQFHHQHLLQRSKNKKELCFCTPSASPAMELYYTHHMVSTKKKGPKELLLAEKDRASYFISHPSIHYTNIAPTSA